MTTSNSVLLLLRDNCFHSGEDLARSLGISRSAIWKVIQALRNKGLDIHSVRGKGYRLSKKIELLDKNIIEQALPSSLHDCFEVYTYFELSSTNDFLLKHIKLSQDDSRSPVCLAEYQTHGRGRRGRVWHSPLGANLYISISWRHKQSPQAVSGFSLVAALALAKSLETLGVNGVGVKWPNDVLWNRKKLAGILLELIGELHGDQLLIIGIGVNVDMPDSANMSINQPHTDLKKITGILLSRNILAAEILKRISEYFKIYEKDGMASFIPEWHSRDTFLNEKVELIFPHQSIYGKVAGIDEQGSLLLDIENGKRQAFQSGEISMRPYGHEI